MQQAKAGDNKTKDFCYFDSGSRTAFPSHAPVISPKSNN
jgi:hypothetical protein